MFKLSLSKFLIFASVLTSAKAQDIAGVQGLGLSSTYSPTSGKIFIGTSEARRTWTVGVDYSHRVYTARFARFDYAATLQPFFQESDPTLTGTSTVLAGATILAPQNPIRVATVSHAPIGTAIAGPGLTSPIYATYGRQKTYAVAVIPLGVRIAALPHRRLQPTFAVDAGMLLSSVDLPVDNSSRFNYVFSFGPGMQLFTKAHSSARLEYLYRHISNAGAGSVNPGIDQGVIRLTLSHLR